MIKNCLKKVVLGVAIMGASLSANSSNYIYDTYSLVGIEGGYGNIDVETNADGYEKLDDKISNIGLKIGAQSDNYRIFLSARYYPHSDFEYFNTYGAEVQYMFNIHESTNFYIGASAGIANIKYHIEGESDSRTLSDPYFGGDAGFNFHATDSIDLELGARVISLDSVNTKNNISYRFNTIITGYASIIFKYKMD